MPFFNKADDPRAELSCEQPQLFKHGKVKGSDDILEASPATLHLTAHCGRLCLYYSFM